jgi:hypothetical protein
MADAVWTACSTPLFGDRAPPNQRGVIISTKAKVTGGMEVAVDPCFLPENTRKSKSCGEGGHEGHASGRFCCFRLGETTIRCDVSQEHGITVPGTCVELIMRG